MSSTRAGGLKAAQKNRERYGKDYYSVIGAIGGKNGHTGGFSQNKEAARICGALGGRIGNRRTPLAPAEEAKYRAEFSKNYQRLLSINQKGRVNA